MKDKIFYIVCFGFMFGVLFRSFVSINLYFAIMLGGVGLAIFLLTLIFESNWGIFVPVFILVFSLGILRFSFADKAPPALFESKVGEKITLSGEIIDEPDIRENNQKLTIETIEEKVKILTTVNFDQDFKYGDEVKIEGKLAKPENFITDQGKEFDYMNYLRKDGILYVMSYPKVEVASRGNGNFLKGALFSVKEKFLENINFAIPAPQNLLMAGLILGEKSLFSQELRQNFINTGTIHIVALSGYNVTIVAEWIMKLFSFLSLNLSIGLGIFTILLFILMTGGSSTAWRAGIMATLALIARATGRNYDVGRGLVLAAVIMIIFNPYVLVFDVSFQLSFLATIAVIFLTPKIEKYFSWVPKTLKLRDIFSVTTAAYIFVFPFILYKMGNLSILALSANILVLPFISFTMILGFLTGFAGLIWYGLAVPVGFLANLLLTYELAIINFLGKVPFAVFTISNFPLALTILIYVYFVYKLFGRNIKNFFTDDIQYELSIQEI